MQPLAIQINLPFCPRRCAHCNRACTAGFDEVEKGRYIDALMGEMRLAASDFEGFEVISVRLAGGTVTGLPAARAGEFMACLRGCYALAPNVEVLADAMPGRVGKRELCELLNAGVTGIHLHAETSQGREDKALARACDPSDLGSTVRLFELEGFSEYGFELALGLPWQTPESFRATLADAFFYSPRWLQLRTGTVRFGEGNYPTTGELEKMYAHARRFLRPLGYRPDIDTLFAREGHGLAWAPHQMSGGAVAGFGAGSWSCFDGVAFSNVANARAYMEAAPDLEKLIARGGPLSDEERALRSFGLGLHLPEGMDAKSVVPGLSGRVCAAVESGVLELVDGRYRLSAASVAVGREFLG